ncbi:hypothetical protein EJC49_15515 [Aquibium carbonis]|uniref:TnsA endonuclease N-terminal domain-containing protein n=1 Tax=Aquibium carbonis TaxID=2495581 RepID=A0A429YVK5_9HYPH|nr:hypothetical protein EJC49_15515 [Aquibium carbonis]
MDPYRRREVWFESSLEESVAVWLLTRPDTREVREQQKVAYRCNGRERFHYFDYVLTRLSGHRTAYAVKYRNDVDDELRETLRLVAEQVGDRFADEYRIITEKDLTCTQIENARDILSYGSDFDAEGCASVAEALTTLPRYVRLGALGSATGLGERGYRAAVSLVQAGALAVPAGVRLGPEAILENRLSGGHR